jgi:FkbM family methyltransferase
MEKKPDAAAPREDGLVLAALREPWKTEIDALRAAMLRDLLPALDIVCVIDVGANRGQTGQFLRREVGFAGLIASFEPNPAAYRSLAAAAKGDPLWLTSQAALGPIAGKRTLNVAKHDVLSSFLTARDAAHDGASAAAVRRIAVPVRRLDGVIESLLKRRGQRRFFVKLDTQGFDLEVMKGLGDEHLDAVPLVMSELAILRRAYLGAPTQMQSLDYFFKRGYRIAGFFNGVSDEQYRAHEMDCLFVR